MAGCINKAILVGNLGRDPEIRYTQDKRPIANLRLATSESWTDKQTGDRRETVEWHNIVIFNENLAKIAEQYLKKGSKVYVEGQLRTRKWQDRQGIDRYSTEVHLQGFAGQITMLGDPKNGNGGDAKGAAGGTNEGTGDPGPDTSGNEGSAPGGYDKTLDDEVPF